MAYHSIGPYEIVDQIGSGGMSTVYHCFDPKFKRDVAVKVLLIEFMHDPTLRSRFNREARTIASIEHPAIVPVYDFGEENEQPYLVMRFMQGGTLGDRLRNGPLPPQEASRIFTALAQALDDMHARGIIHRDLKPANILFDSLGNPCLSDFGIAKLQEASAALTGSKMIGTPAYISPEQVNHEDEVTGRSDIYSLGVILFEMLTGQRPYKSSSHLALVLMHCNDPIPLLSDFNPELPEAMQAVIERSMAKKQEERYSSVAEFATDLQRVLSERSEREPDNQVPIPEEPDRPVKQRMIQISIAVFAVLLGILALPLVQNFLYRNISRDGIQRLEQMHTPVVVHETLADACSELSRQLVGQFPGNHESLAIFGFSCNEGGLTESQTLAVASALSTTDALNRSFHVLDRKKIMDLLREKDFLEDKLSDDDKITVAYELETDLFLTGQITRHDEVMIISTRLITPSDIRELGSSKTNVSVNALIEIPPGTFMMGSDEKEFSRDDAEIEAGDPTSASMTEPPFTPEPGPAPMTGRD